MEKYCLGENVLTNGLRRKIGNGQSTRAFRDPWLSRPPSFLPITKGNEEEVKVSKYITGGTWNRELIQQTFLSPDVQLILEIPLSRFERAESLFWHYNGEGNYTVEVDIS